MKKMIKKMTGLSLALFLLLNNSTAFAKESWYEDTGVEHADLKYSQMEYAGVNEEECEALVDSLLKAAEEDNNEETVLELYDRIVVTYDYICTQSSLNSIRYYNDPTNEEYSDIDSKLSEYLTFWGDLACASVKEITKSQYAEALRTHINNEDLYSMFEDYEELTEEESELLKEENKLVQEYDEVAVGDYDSYKEENELAAPIYLELVKNRNAYAKLKGYDNYAEYAYDSAYVRDYSLEEIKNFYKNVKEYIVPLYEELTSNYYFADDLEDFKPSQEEQLALVAPYLEKIDPELVESFNYMVDHELCDLKDSDTKLDVGYTDTFYYYGAPFILNAPEDNWYRVETLVHEFGHYNTSYFTDGHAIESKSNMDVAEIDSQGLEVLFLDYADEMYGEENADNVRMVVLTNLLSSVIDGCLFDEFQYRAYSSEKELSVEELNNIFIELMNDYGYGVSAKDDFAYYWVVVSHNFESPMYYISYATSAISALDIFAISIDDYDRACDKYMEVTSYGMGTPYVELIYDVGLRNPFDGRAVKAIADTVSDYGNDIIDRQLSDDKAMIRENIIMAIAIIGLVIILIVLLKFRRNQKKALQNRLNS